MDDSAAASGEFDTEKPNNKPEPAIDQAKHELIEEQQKLDADIDAEMNKFGVHDWLPNLWADSKPTEPSNAVKQLDADQLKPASVPYALPSANLGNRLNFDAVSGQPPLERVSAAYRRVKQADGAVSEDAYLRHLRAVHERDASTMPNSLAQLPFETLEGKVSTVAWLRVVMSLRIPSVSMLASK